MNKKPITNSLTGDQRYFVSYIETAVSNVFKIRNHISERFGIKPLNEKNDISLIFEDLLRNKTNQVFSVLAWHFPVANLFDSEKLPKTEKHYSIRSSGKDFGKLSDTLIAVLKEFDEIRDYCKHSFSEGKPDKTFLKVSYELKDFLNKYFLRAIQYTREKHKGILTEDDFETALKTELVTSDNLITTDGLTFFISMFLDKETAFRFINDTCCAEHKNEKGFWVKREVMMTFCINLPDAITIIEQSKQLFSKEIINEIKKCPITLFNVISEKEKQKFLPLISDNSNDYKKYEQKIKAKIRTENRFSYFALKYIDHKKAFKKLKFHFVLGDVFLDEYPKKFNGAEETRTVFQNAKAFGRLQDFSDSEKVLGKINQGESKTRFGQFTPHYNCKNNKIGISKLKATSKLVSGSAGKKVRLKIKRPHPIAFLSVHELPKIILLEHLEKGKAEQLITDFIEINNAEIFDKKFIEIIKSELSDSDIFRKRSRGRKGKSAYNADTMDLLLKRKTKLNQLLAEYNININQIPGRICDYWLNIEDVKTAIAVADRIKLMKRDCIARLKKIANKKTPSINEMAAFLAKDIINMIAGVEKKMKITSFYYSKIKECIALFADDDKKNLFINICTNELNLYDENGHPFLKNIDLARIKNTEGFYKIYLQEKGKKIVRAYNPKTGKYSENDKSWLETNFYIKKRNEKAEKILTEVMLPADKSNVPFTLRQSENEKTSFDSWLKNVTKGKTAKDRKKPVDLPTNLFDERLTDLLKRELSERNIEFDETANYNKLFKLWWEKCRNDGVQGFYEAEREYSFDGVKLNFGLNTKQRFEDYINPGFAEKVYYVKQKKRSDERKYAHNLPPIDKERFLKTIRNIVGSTEKEIRITGEQDRLMFLMLEKLTKINAGIKLKDM